MYVLESREKNQVGRNSNKNYKSFEDFEFLMREKKDLEVKGFLCFVYKVSNNGKEVSRLSDKSVYEVVTDFDKEYRKGWKQYVSIRNKLVENGYRDFYVDNNILYIRNENVNIEIEMVKKTPRYEVRYNGKVVSDCEVSQNDIIEKMFSKVKGENGFRLLKRWRVGEGEVRYN